MSSQARGGGRARWLGDLASQESRMNRATHHLALALSQLLIGGLGPTAGAQEARGRVTCEITENSESGSG